MKVASQENIGKPSLNFLKLFSDVGNLWTTELKQNIRRQQSIDGSKFYPIEASTARARASKTGAQSTMARIWNKGIVPKTGKVRKSLAKSVAITRLVFTEKFWQRMLVFAPSKLSLTVEGNPQSYDSSVSYSDIIAYNNRNSKETNQNVKPAKRPMIFPTNSKELEQTKTFKKFERMLKQEATKQLKEQLYISKKVTVKL
jgi:hypothetical protein